MDWDCSLCEFFFFPKFLCNSITENVSEIVNFGKEIPSQQCTSTPTEIFGSLNFVSFCYVSEFYAIQWPKMYYREFQYKEFDSLTKVLGNFLIRTQIFLYLPEHFSYVKIKDTNSFLCSAKVLGNFLVIKTNLFVMS